MKSFIARALVLPLLATSCAPPRSRAKTPGAVAAPAEASASTAPAAAPDPYQKFAELKACPLESGQMIEGCRIGYRTFGKLDDAKSNAILFPTWFSGTTKDLVGIAPDKLVDTKRFYLILTDALGDGVSTSASNTHSKTQVRLGFPKFTIKDMVVNQHRMLTEALGIPHLRAVMGISMGGMQAIEWGVTYPDFVDKIVPIVGTPQLTSNDLLLWTTELHALEADHAYANGNYAGHPPIKSVLDVHNLALTTPAFRAGQTSRAAFSAWLAEREGENTFDWNDWRRQLEAMLSHDVTRPYGSMEAAAKHVKAKALFVVADQDHMVSPLPARAFAKAMGPKAKVVSLDGPCGHAAPTCEAAKLNAAVTAFLR